ncbi:MAG TPA: PAS domain S-box protein, partial [Burkholderiaceae bacterium]
FQFLARWTQMASFSRAVVAGFVLLNSLVLALVVLSLVRSRDDHRDRAAVATQNIAQLLDRGVTESLQRTDRALLTVSDELQREIAENGIDGHVLNDFLVRAFSRQPDFDTLVVTDDRGEVIVAAGQASVSRANVASQPFFTQLRDDSRAGVRFFTAGRAGAGEGGVVIARRIESRIGGFGGIVFATIGQERFRKAFTGIDLGSSGLLAIRDLEFAPVVREPPLPAPETAAGTGAVSQAFKAAVFANPEGGTFKSANGFDGIERISTYRKVPGYPYYVIVGLSTDDYLLAWRHEAFPILALAAAFGLATFLLADLLNRYWKRKDAAAILLAKQEARFRRLLEGAPDALVIVDSRALIVMINERTETMFGYSRAELVGQALDILVPERFRSDHAAMVRRYIANAETRRMGVGRSLWAVTKEGKEFAVNISLSPIETDDGTLVTADIRDVTGLVPVR